MGYGAEKIREIIVNGQTVLGIELGSTRIKAVLLDNHHKPIVSGEYQWENSLIDGMWTYDLEEVWQGIQGSYAHLVENLNDQYSVPLEKIGAIGISGMMHGYLVFDARDQLLVPFRTWRNNCTGVASEALTRLFEYPIPQRWSVAHLYQAILNKELHVPDINFMTTLAGYVHWKLTGEKVIGVCEGSAMFPIDLESMTYDKKMLGQFGSLTREHQLTWQVENLLPKVLLAGDVAGYLSEEGAKLLDPRGVLSIGMPLCPPEGDAGTGMVATNSITPRTGNISAGTSIFALIVLEKALSKVYEEIDLVLTPSGKMVALVHSNNCTSDLDSWVSLFGEAMTSFGVTVDQSKLYETLYQEALKGDADCGGLLAYGYLSGEHMTHFEEGRPLFVRSSRSQFNLANFMRTHLYTALGALKIGLDILLQEESVLVDKVLGHGGLFKTPLVGQRLLAAAINTEVEVMATAGEGGAWGIGLLASYMLHKSPDESLETFLDEHVFKHLKSLALSPETKDVKGFEVFMERYKAGLPIEKAAVQYCK